MILNLHRVNYDGTTNPNGHWWVWKETCDKCGKIIFDESVQHSDNKDAFVEANFCSDCIRELMSKNIPYHDAVEKYKKRIES